MRRINKQIAPIVITIFLIGVTAVSSYAQNEKWSVNAGIGNIENLNVGIESYFSKRNSMAITFGFWQKSTPLPYSSYQAKFYQYSIMLNHQLYLGFSKKYEALPTWYLGDRLGYVYKSDDGLKTGYIAIVLVMGRKIFITPGLGLNIDMGAGVAFLLMEHIPENTYTINDSPDFLIEGRVQCFYRF